MTSRPSPALVIFDCDGVLVNSERIAVRVDAEVLTEMRWPTSEAEVIERFVGRSHKNASSAWTTSRRASRSPTCSFTPPSR